MQNDECRMMNVEFRIQKGNPWFNNTIYIKQEI
jgi:hypothetical protein